MRQLPETSKTQSAAGDRIFADRPECAVYFSMRSPVGPEVLPAGGELDAGNLARCGVCIKRSKQYEARIFC